MLGNSVDRYGTASRVIHWLTALIILTLIGVGMYMSDLPKTDPSRLQIYDVHKAFGVLVIVLLLLRLVWLRIQPAPALPAILKPAELKLLKVVKAGLYLLMFLVPVAGYTMSVAGGHPVSFFGWFTLPDLFGKSKALGGFAHEMHGILAYTLLALVALHVAGAIKHRLKGNAEADLLKRMM